jgi:hypothetical protein
MEKFLKSGKVGDTIWSVEFEEHQTTRRGNEQLKNRESWNVFFLFSC